MKKVYDAETVAMFMFLTALGAISPQSVVGADVAAAWKKQDEEVRQSWRDQLAEFEKQATGA